MATVKEILTRRPILAEIRLRLPAGVADVKSNFKIVPQNLGQYRVNIGAFLKEFNAKTQKYKPEAPITVTVTVLPNHSYEMTLQSPPVTWYLMKAAGLEEGSPVPGRVVASKVSVKHVYEIAKVKQSDPFCKYLPLESICKSIMGTARSMGLEVV